MALGFYINNAECYGCKTCSMSCNLEHQLPNDVFRRVVTDVRVDGPKALSFISMGCNHCDEPACVDVCPTDSYTKLDNGIVIQNHETCIGCKSCIEACPYDAPQYSEVDEKTHKCDLCYDRLEQGKTPSCVEMCPGLNLDYGEMEELKERYPDAVDQIDDYTASPDETKANVLYNVDQALQ